MNNITSLLNQLDLNPKEVQVFEILLKNGSASAKEISLATELNRTSIYFLIDSLQSRGLVYEYEQDKKRRFACVGLNGLLDLIDGEIYKKKRIQKRLIELRNYFEVTEALQKRPTKVGFYDNPVSIGRLYSKMIEDFGKLDEDAEVFVWINPEKMERVLPGWLLDDAHHNFNIKNFNQIMTDSDFARKYIDYLDRWNNKGLTTTKFNYKIWNGEDLFETDNVIWGDKVSFVDYSTNSGFVIENQAVANDLRTILKNVWNDKS